MRLVPTFSSALAAICFASFSVGAQPVERMAWLAGCWQSQFGEPGTVEHSLRILNTTSLNESRTPGKESRVCPPALRACATARRVALSSASCV
jgi:hypothetical protein